MLRSTTILPLMACLTLLGCGQSATPPATSDQSKTADAQISATLAKLNASDRDLANKQIYCVINTKGRLGSMGVPLKLDVQGTPVFVCCAGCKKKALADPATTLAKLAELKSQHHETN